MSTARESAFNRAVEFCYDMDGDPKRNGIRYFSPPEDYVEVAFDALLDEVVEALRSMSTQQAIELLDGAFIGNTPQIFAAFLEAEFGVPQPEQPA